MRPCHVLQVGLNRGCLIVAEMSSSGTLITEDYVTGTVKEITSLLE